MKSPIHLCLSLLLAGLGWLSLSSPSLGARPDGTGSGSVALDNGARFEHVRGEGPPTLTFLMEVGRRFDPPGQEGLAEVTAHALLGGTPEHSAPGSLTAALGGLASEAWTSVGPDSSAVMLGGVTDVPGALRLMTSVFSQASLPYVSVMEARTSLARELHELTPAQAARMELHDLLAGLPTPAEKLFSLASIRQHDARIFHGRHYRPSRLRVVLHGQGPETGLKEAVKTSIGAWTSASPISDEPPPRELEVAEGMTCRLLIEPQLGELALGFGPGRGEALKAAVALALASEEAEGWHLSAGAMTAAGDLAMPEGHLLLSRSTSDAMAARAALMNELDRLAKRGASRRNIRALADRLRPGADEAGLSRIELSALAQEGETATLSGLVASLRKADIKRGAQALLDGPKALVALGPGGDWETECDELDLRPFGTLPEAVDEERSKAARALVARAVEAHGGEDFLALRQLSMVGQHEAVVMGESREAARTRVDSDYGAMVIRQETRHASKRAGTYLVHYDAGATKARGPNGKWLEYPPLACMTYRNTFERQPIPLLRRAARADAVMRLLGPGEFLGTKVVRVVLADPDLGLTRLSFDATSHLLVGVEYQNRFPYQSEPADVVMSYTDHHAVGAAKLHGTELSTSPDGAVGTRISAIEWTLQGADFAPLRVVPRTDDLSIIDSVLPEG